MQGIFFYMIYGVIWVLTLLPLSILYIISSCSYLLIYYIFRYRRSVVRRNLKKSFPEKSKAQILQLEKRFYRYFCDLFVETLKIMHLSKEEMIRRVKFTNMDLFDRFYKEGKSCILYMAHYGNWEWMTFGGYLNLKKNPDYVSRPVYYALKDKYFNQLFFQLRSTFDNEPVETKHIFRKIIETQKVNKLSVFTFVADQTPNRANIHHWMTFMNQETPVITGTERIAKQTGFPVLYFDIQRLKRGYYTCDTILITEDARLMSEFELTEKYMHLVENSIKRDPSIYLWTHKRWKHKRQL